MWGTIVIGLWGIDADTAISLFMEVEHQLAVQALGSLAYAVWAVVLSFIVFMFKIYNGT